MLVVVDVLVEVVELVVLVVLLDVVELVVLVVLDVVELVVLLDVVEVLVLVDVDVVLEVVDVVVVVGQPQVSIGCPLASTKPKPAGPVGMPSNTSSAMMSLLELLPDVLYATMLVLHAHTAGPLGAV